MNSADESKWLFAFACVLGRVFVAFPLLTALLYASYARFAVWHRPEMADMMGIDLDELSSDDEATPAVGHNPVGTKSFDSANAQDLERNDNEATPPHNQFLRF